MGADRKRSSSFALARQGFRQQNKERIVEAIQSYGASLRLQPLDAATWNNFGAALLSMGAAPESVRAFEAALDLAPTEETPRSNLLFALLHDWSADAGKVSSIHRALAARLPRTTPSAEPLLGRSLGRLRVGYLSPGFGAHAASQFSLPPVHDPNNIEVYCYSTRHCSDAITDEYRRRYANWFDLGQLSDESAAWLVRSHQLDLLVDRGGYCEENRVGLMARRIAPIQVSTADYSATLGMQEVQFHVTDGYINPPSTQRLYVEKLVHLPSAMCYQPPLSPPAVSALPTLGNKFVTFGAFHRLFKLSPALLETYASLLTRLPRSRILLHHAYGPSAVVPANLKVRVNQTLASFGVSPRRLRWVGTLPHRQSMALYRETDLALGAFPCGGVTTTAEALFMGNPVVAWYNEEPRSRHSLSMLAAVGLEDLAVDSAARFVDKAVELASDLPRLSGLRRTLRKRVLASRLCDQAAYAQSLEAAYRQMIAETRLAAKV